MPDKPVAKSIREEPILVAGAQWWRCPYCQAANGIPEVSVCACGATAVVNAAGRPVRARRVDAAVE